MKEQVIACIDGSVLSEAVCDYASWIATKVDAPLKLLNTIDHHHEMANSSDLSGNIGVDSRDHLLEEMTQQEQQQTKQRLQQGKAILQNASDRILAAGNAAPEICLQHGKLVDALTELEAGIRVLVIGARGKVHEDQPHQIGAKLESMIRSLHLPILVAYESFQPPKRIMIAYNGKPSADQAVNIVTNSPLYHGLECHLVQVSKTSNETDQFDRAADKLSKVTGLQLIKTHLQGEATQQLCQYQSHHQIDMTIMGAFSHSRIHDLILGSFTVKMLLNSNTPLLLLR